MAKRKKPAPVAERDDKPENTFKPSETIGEVVLGSLEDIALEAKLDGVGFAAPVCGEDLAELYRQIHAMPWSQKPYVDIYCVDGKTVKLAVDVGPARFRRIYVAQ